MSAVITAASLAEVGDAIRDHLHALANNPSAAAAADVIVTIEGARREVQRLRTELMQAQEVPDDGAE